MSVSELGHTWRSAGAARVTFAKPRFGCRFGTWRMSNPNQPSGPGYQHGYPQQGYPAQGQQQQHGHPHQGYQQPQAHPQAQQGVPPGPAKKKKGKGLLLAILVLVPIVGLGGWLGYQHFETYGYLRAPAKVQKKVDPTIEIMRDMAEKVARVCRVGSEGLREAEFSLTDNPLEGSKVLKLKGLVAARASCDRAFGVSDDGVDEMTKKLRKPDVRFHPLEQEDLNRIKLSNEDSDDFACMAPNFLGIEDTERNDCVIWKGRRVHYYVERTNGSKRGIVAIELE